MITIYLLVFTILAMICHLIITTYNQIKDFGNNYINGESFNNTYDYSLNDSYNELFNDIELYKHKNCLLCKLMLNNV